MRRPFVTANFAITADGRIAIGGGASGGIGSAADKRRLLEIRAGCDAILAGARTVAADNMAMGLPANDLVCERVRRGKTKYPLRVVVSNSGKLDSKLKVFQQTAGQTIVFSTQKMSRRVQEAIVPSAELYLFESTTVNLAIALSILRDDFGIQRMVCEGGGTLLKSLLIENLVDELNITLCPRIFGGKKSPTLTGIIGDFLPASVRLKLMDMQPVGTECFTRWKIRR